MSRHLATPCALLGVTLVVSTSCAPSSEPESLQCGSDEGEYLPLIDNERWQVLDADDDPLPDHQPAQIECTIAGWQILDGTLDVDTNFCNYLQLHQASLRDLCEGQGVELILYHYDLTAPEPATAHLEILVDGQSLWSQEIAIPGDANVYDLEFPSPITAPAGSEVVFHLHNHGQNTWVLQDLNVRS